MAAVAVFLDHPGSDLGQPPAVRNIGFNELHQLIDLRLRTRVTRQRLRRLRGRRVDPDHRLILVSTSQIAPSEATVIPTGAPCGRTPLTLCHAETSSVNGAAATCGCTSVWNPGLAPTHS